MANKLHWLRKLDPNLVIAVGVLISSFAALYIYVRQTSIMNEQTMILLEQTKASIWPHVSIELSTSSSPSGIEELRLSVVNKGTGPAILEQTRISLNGKYAQSWKSFYDLLNTPDSIRVFHTNQNINGRVLASQERLKLIRWWRESEEHNRREFLDYIWDKADQIKVEVCYRSIHGDTWQVSRLGFKTDIEQNERTVLEACNFEEGQLFLQ
ncbi:MAG: hypothetical protein AAF798_23140 [Bacteroidota bacterium]